MSTTSKRSIFLTSLSLILAVLLSACGPSATPEPTPDMNAIFTQAAATIVGGITQTAEAMPTATPVPPTATPEPSATPTEVVATEVPTQAPANPVSATATPIPVDPSTAFGCYNASFVAHVTLPYAPAFKPGDKFTKTWRIKNTGSCDWPRGFQIIFAGGDRFGTENTTLGQKVTAGSFAEISLSMQAPYLAGVVSSSWQMATDIGKPFGQLMTASITLPGDSAVGATPGGCLNSLLVSDVDVPSGTKFNPGENFTKTWQIQNTGTCEWNNDFKIVFVSGDVFGSDTTKIRKIVGPGSSAEISLRMTAPGTAGTYSSTWQLASDSGSLFGQYFTFSIIVK